MERGGRGVLVVSSVLKAGEGESEGATGSTSELGPVSAVGEKKPVSVGHTRGTFFSAWSSWNSNSSRTASRSTANFSIVVLDDLF